MHKTQDEYVVAKVVLEVLKERKETAMKEWQAINGSMRDNGHNEEFVERFYTYMGQVETEIGYWPAQDRLTAAENAMIEWATGTIMHLASKRDATTISNMVSKARTFEMLPSHRKHLIALSFALEAK